MWPLAQGCRAECRSGGFSLVELLVAMTLSAVVGMAALSVFTGSSATATVQQNVSETQQNVRVAMDRLAKDIRMAGFGLPHPLSPLDFGGGNVFSAPVTVVNSSSASDTITLLGLGYPVGTLLTGASVDCNGSDDGLICLETLESVNRFFADDLSTFLDARRYISLDGLQFFELAAAGHDRVNRKLRLGAPSSLQRSYPDGTPVYILQAVEYSVATDLDGCSATLPCLVSHDFTGLRDSGRQVVADAIEDLQLACGIDSSPRDGTIDYVGSYDADAFLYAPADPASIIAIRASLVAKTGHADPRASGTFQREALEDRPAGSADGFRRRVLTKVIKVRNAPIDG